MRIESLQNEKIKHLSRLISDNRFRKKEGVFVVEGQQENRRAIHFGYQAQEFFICDEIFNAELPDFGKIHQISAKIYEKLAYRSKTEGILGIYKVPEKPLQNYNPTENAKIIVVESVEKPGNLGAIIRSCEAFGIEALIITDEKLDLYNPNVIRSSVGCLFGMNIFHAENEECAEFLQNFKIFTTMMSEDAVSLSGQNFSGKSAVIFGTEHSGLSDFWKNKGQNMLIKMRGTIDSLNLSNAVAITCYEMSRNLK